LKLACIFLIFIKKEAQKTSLKWLIEVFIKSVSPPPDMTRRLVLAARIHGAGGGELQFIWFSLLI
jgi:hypothetical protein